MGAAIHTALLPVGHREWKKIEIVGRHASGKTLVREIGRLWPGLALVEACDLVLPRIERRAGEGAA